MPLSERQKNDFAKLGFFVLGKVFDDAELRELSAAYDEVLASPLHLGEAGKGKFEYAPLLQMRSAVCRRFATSPRLVAPMIEILGPDVRLYWDQAVSKPPGATSDVPWHQDNGYLAVEPEEYATCTVALDAMTRENGCLWIQPGSHHRGTQPHRKTDFFFQIGYDGPESGVPVELAAGEVLVFSSLTMHRTGPNASDRPRRSWVIQFCQASARNRETKEPFDDRLLVARDGIPLDEPIAERPFNFTALLRQAARDAMRS
jgi:ectoine hydroxylase-related dioxygenase (phytanoyl-CoA dioxygenase family)